MPIKSWEKFSLEKVLFFVVILAITAVNVGCTQNILNTVEKPTITSISTQSSSNQPTKKPTSTFTPTPFITDTPSPSPLPSNTPTPSPLCGGPESMIILVTGIDADNYVYGLADAIRLVKVDFLSGEVDVLPLPRDLWVEIPVSVPGVTKDITPGKLNQAYFYGTPGMGYYEGEDQGPGLLAKTIERNLAIEIDHYFSVNTNVFQEMVDALGGLQVYLPNTVYKHYFNQPKVYLEAGSYLLTGKQAEMVARHRTVIGDFGRQANQTILLKAMVKRLFSVEGLKSLPELVEIYRESVLMDFSSKEIGQLICLASKVDLEDDVFFHSFPKDLLTEERKKDPVQGYWPYTLTYDAEEISAMIQEKLEMDHVEN